ncbi:uncharacterized protein [Miscanthus floridulus]|uniref:uncharacterized protein n=1 Tax=Miscanthus floridulus TaxID=154761 RepID=UPI003458CB71
MAAPAAACEWAAWGPEPDRRGHRQHASTGIGGVWVRARDALHAALSFHRSLLVPCEAARASGASRWAGSHRCSPSLLRSRRSSTGGYWRWYGASCYDDESLSVESGAWPWRLTAFQRLRRQTWWAWARPGCTGRSSRARAVIAVKKLWRPAPVDGDAVASASELNGDVLKEVVLLGRLTGTSCGCWAYGYTLKVDQKSDIYSYGVVLMELITGHRAVEVEFGEGQDIVGWVRNKIRSHTVEEHLDPQRVRSSPILRPALYTREIQDATRAICAPYFTLARSSGDTYSCKVRDAMRFRRPWRCPRCGPASRGRAAAAMAGAGAARRAGGRRPRGVARRRWSRRGPRIAPRVVRAPQPWRRTGRRAPATGPRGS